MTKIFISYSSKNRPCASKLAQNLKNIGIDVSIDYEFIDTGRRFPEQIWEKIVPCDILVFLVSQDSIASDWVSAEVGLAQRLSKKIIPMILDKTDLAYSPSFWQLLYIEHIQFSAWEDEEAFSSAFAKLQRAIKPIRESKSIINANNSHKIKNLATLTGHKGTVRCVRFSHDGQILASCAEDNNIILWKNYQPYQMLEGHSQSVLSIAFSSDGKYLASVSADLKILLWDTVDYQIVQQLEGHSEDIRYVQFSHDSKYMATASYDGSVLLWDTERWEAVHQLKGHSDYVRSVAFSRDDQYIASASKDDSIRIWDTTNGQIINILKQHSKPVHSVDYSSIGKFLVSGSYDKTICVWDIASWKLLAQFKAHAWIRFIKFSPKEQLIASAGDDNIIRLWDIKNLEEITSPLVGHYNSVLALDFSPQGHLLASAGGDGTVKIWGIQE
jgi:WD40 repeat protein